MGTTEHGRQARLIERVHDTMARWWLRGATRVGARPRLRGRPRIANYGELVVGDDFQLASTPVRSHLFAAIGATFRIGDRVCIGAGAALSCYGSVEVEDDVAIGAFAIVLDSDFHLAEDRNASSQARRIRIGRGARIGHRVIVLPGSTIGESAVIRAGSVVSGEVAPGARVEGNPARVRSPEAGPVPRGRPADRAVPELVMRVLGLARVPEPTSGPEQIPQWDSLGTLRLILALEEEFSITLSEQELKSARSVRELVDRVDAAQARKAAVPPAAA